MSVSTYPGQIALTVMPCAATSSASDLGQTEHAMLRRRVSRNVRRARLAGNRSDIDDASPAAFDHFRQRRVSAAKRPAGFVFRMLFQKGSSVLTNNSDFAMPHC
jgi:hypothetical protein